LYLCEYKFKIMDTEKIIEEIKNVLDETTRELSNQQYEEVLEELYSEIKFRLEALDLED